MKPTQVGFTLLEDKLKIISNKKLQTLKLFGVFLYNKIKVKNQFYDNPSSFSLSK